MNVHFLHIGKTGGTAVKLALRDVGSVVFHDHSVSLSDLPNESKVVFFLRDPISRFYSGFYSRKRQGKPRYNFPWTNDEYIAFSHFKTPEELLDAAAEKSNYELYSLACFALKSIQHVRDHYDKWLISIKYLKKRSNNIFFIGFQERFDSDLNLLMDKLYLPRIDMSNFSDVEIHRNPTYEFGGLDAKHLLFLKEWYEVDYEIYSYCMSVADNFH